MKLLFSGNRKFCFLIVPLFVIVFIAVSWFRMDETKPLKKRDIARLHHLEGELRELRIDGVTKSIGELCGSEKAAPFIKFSGSSTVRGSICCNEFSGSYKIEANTNNLEFGSLGMTSVGCLTAPQDDFDILGIIQDLSRIEFKGSRIILSSKYHINEFRYEAVKDPTL